MDAPLNAAEAASQLSDVWADLHTARNESARREDAHTRLEHLYRTAKSRALIDPALDGRNKEARDAAANEWALSGDQRTDGAKVATAMGLDGTVPETVGDLRWLRDRAKAMAEVSSARAYDQRARLQGWQVVAAFARSEAELAPPAHMGVAS